MNSYQRLKTPSSINLCQYVAAITILDYSGKLRETKERPPEKPGWLILGETKIEAIRRHLSHIDVVLKCKAAKRFTKRQKIIEGKVRKRFGRTTVENLMELQMRLKQNLKCETEKIRRRKTIRERKIVNHRFNNNPKSVYREFRKEKNISVEKGQHLQQLQQFWGNIWGEEVQFNRQAEWLKYYRIIVWLKYISI